MSVEEFNKAIEDVRLRQQIRENETKEIRNQKNLQLRLRYEDILSPQNKETISNKMLILRKLVIDCGLPQESDEEMVSFADQCSLRGKVWKLLLGVLRMDAKQYLDIVKLGPSPEDRKIRNDTFRTYKSNEEFWQRVDEKKMSRVLNAFARLNNPEQHEQQRSQGEAPPAARPSGGYVQGMNVLAAPFLFVLPELDAFTAFSALISKHCPRYVASNLDGAHHGCSLVSRALEILDPELHNHISEKICRAEIFAFQFVITLLANMLPLPEVVKVWDAIFAFGVHFDVLLVAAHVMLLRDRLLAEESAFRIQKLIVQEPLNAEVLVEGAVRLVRFIPSSLFDELIRHPVEKPSDIKQVLSRDFQEVSSGGPDDEYSPPPSLSFSKQPGRSVANTARGGSSAAKGSGRPRPTSAGGVRRIRRGGRQLSPAPPHAVNTSTVSTTVKPVSGGSVAVRRSCSAGRGGWTAGGGRYRPADDRNRRPSSANRRGPRLQQNTGGRGSGGVGRPRSLGRSQPLASAGEMEGAPDGVIGRSGERRARPANNLLAQTEVGQVQGGGRRPRSATRR